MEEKLKHWPMHLEMVPIKDEIYDGADILLASDCATYGYGFKVNDFRQGRVPVIGCHKVDKERYNEKFLEILKQNDIKKVTIVRVDLFCCERIEKAAREAIIASGKDIELEVYAVTMENKVEKK